MAYFGLYNFLNILRLIFAGTPFMYHQKPCQILTFTCFFFLHGIVLNISIFTEAFVSTPYISALCFFIKGCLCHVAKYYHLPKQFIKSNMELKRSVCEKCLISPIMSVLHVFSHQSPPLAQMLSTLLYHDNVGCVLSNYYCCDGWNNFMTKLPQKSFTEYLGREMEYWTGQ